MKSFFALFFISALALTAQTNWYVNSANGNDANNGLACTSTTPGTGPKQTLTSLFATGAVHNGDKIWIAAGTYKDCPKITKNVVIIGHSLGNNHAVTFDLSTGHFIINSTGIVNFTTYAGCNEPKITEFRFLSTSPAYYGIKILSGKIWKINTVDFHISGKVGLFRN